MGVTRGAWHRGRAWLSGIKIQKGYRSVWTVAAASECPPRLIRNCHTCFQYKRHLSTACLHDLCCSERFILLSSLQVYFCAPKIVIIYRGNIAVPDNSYSFNYLFIYFCNCLFHIRPSFSFRLLFPLLFFGVLLYFNHIGVHGRVILTHWGLVTQICVFTLQLCKTDDANLRF
jgi:hypothetical protein